MGSAVGVSACSALLARNVQVSHSELVGSVTPFNPAYHPGAVGALLAPGTAKGAAMLDAMVNQQAAIIAYLDDFKAMLIVSAPSVLLLLLMKRPAVAEKMDPAHAAME